MASAGLGPGNCAKTGVGRVISGEIFGDPGRNPFGEKIFREIRLIYNRVVLAGKKFFKRTSEGPQRRGVLINKRKPLFFVARKICAEKCGEKNFLWGKKKNPGV